MCNVHTLFESMNIAPKPNNATNGVADDKIMPKPAEIRPKSPSRRTIGKQIVGHLNYESN